MRNAYILFSLLCSPPILAGNFFDSWPVCPPKGTAIEAPAFPFPENGPSLSSLIASRIPPSSAYSCPLRNTYTPTACFPDRTKCEVRFANSYCDFEGNLVAGPVQNVACDEQKGRNATCGTKDVLMVVGCNRCKAPLGPYVYFPVVKPEFIHRTLACGSAGTLPGNDGLEITACATSPDCPQSGVPCCKAYEKLRDSDGLCDGPSREAASTSCTSAAPPTSPIPLF